MYQSVALPVVAINNYSHPFGKLRSCVCVVMHI